MTDAFPFNLALAVALAGATSASAQISASKFAVVVHGNPTVNPAVAAAIQNQVLNLPPTAIAKTVPAAGAAAPPSGADDTNQPPAVQPRLEYVHGSTQLDVQAAQALASHTDIKNVIGSDGAVIALPGFIRQVDQSGSELQLKMIALAGKKLAFDRSLNVFVGTVWLGVNEIVAGRPSQQLVTPVDFKILDAESADPVDVEVTSTGEPGYKQVQLQLGAAMGQASVKIASNLAPDPTELPLPLKPALIISSDSPIDGFGLATSTINVSALGLPQAKGFVTFQRTAGNGSLTVKKVALDADGTATTDLRSEGLGGGTVTAGMPGLVPVPTNVKFQFPYVTILASILGGIVGGLIRVGASRIRGRRASQALGIAVLVGILVFALYAVGVNVLPITPVVKAGAILVFVVSAMGAFIGPSVLPKAA